MDKLKISNRIFLNPDQIQFQAIRAQGAGGQNVNKVSTAIHLQFDLNRSSLPESFKAKVLALRDQRISASGVITIKSQRSRSQEQNKAEAIERLIKLLQKAALTQKARKATKPSRNSQKRRMDSKTRRGQLKSLRGKVRD